jgi:HSP20 family protein
MRRRDPSDWMWSEACNLIEQAERLHRQFFRLNASARSNLAWEPPVDVFEGEREVVIVAAMPGVTSERVEVVQEPGALVLRGERPLPLAGVRLTVRQLEIPYGRFERRVPLPSGRFEYGAHEMTLGCLVLRLHRIG